MEDESNMKVMQNHFLIAQRCLIYLGDLERYHAMHSQQSDNKKESKENQISYDKAVACYRQALHLAPGNTHTHTPKHTYTNILGPKQKKNPNNCDFSGLFGSCLHETFKKICLQHWQTHKQKAYETHLICH